MAQKVLVIGGSRNSGYFSALGFLQSGATVTFLLRSPAVFDTDNVMQEYIKSGRARLVKGDALVLQDVRCAWAEAATGEGQPRVDLLIFTVGAIPKFHPTKGFVLDPPNLVTQALLNVVCTMPRSDDFPQTKIIAITSMGISRSSHASLPFILKPLYNFALSFPHADKRGAERVLAHCAGWRWNVKDDGEPSEEIMGDWLHREGLPGFGTLTSVLVVRPALLTDGERKAGKRGREVGYEVTDQESGGWTVSRKDVAHFIVEAGTRKWDEFANANKRIYISY